MWAKEQPGYDNVWNDDLRPFNIQMHLNKRVKLARDPDAVREMGAHVSSEEISEDLAFVVHEMDAGNKVGRQATHTQSRVEGHSVNKRWYDQ